MKTLKLILFSLIVISVTSCSNNPKNQVLVEDIIINNKALIEKKDTIGGTL